MHAFHDVGTFQDKFGLDNVTFKGIGPREVDDELMQFRIKFLYEELKEFEDAYAADDEAGMFDALLDLVYVAYGTAHLRGYPWIIGWRAIQEANMNKVRADSDGSNSKRSSSYDVVKPPGWRAPDIRSILARFGWKIDKPRRCPRCDSPDPKKHPAMQFEGEVQPCSDSFHEVV